MLVVIGASRDGSARPEAARRCTLTSWRGRSRIGDDAWTPRGSRLATGSRSTPRRLSSNGVRALCRVELTKDRSFSSSHLGPSLAAHGCGRLKQRHEAMHGGPRGGLAVDDRGAAAPARGARSARPAPRASPERCSDVARQRSCRGNRRAPWHHEFHTHRAAPGPCSCAFSRRRVPEVALGRWRRLRRRCPGGATRRSLPKRLLVALELHAAARRRGTT